MNRISFTMMNHKHDPVISALLSDCMDSGIAAVETNGKYSINVTFKDGSKLNAWNANRYYAWLSQGWIEQPNESKYQWEEARPSRDVMARLYNMLKNYSSVKNQFQP